MISKRRKFNILPWLALGILIAVLIFVPRAPKIDVTSPAAPVSDPRIESLSIKEEGKNPPYLIEVEYPKLTGLADEAVTKAVNAAITDSINGTIVEFKNNLNQPPPEAAEAINALSGRYEIGYLSKDILSLALTGSAYASGAAHPTNYVLTLNFDLRNGHKARLSELLLPESDYLAAISDFSIAALQKELEIGNDAEELSWLKAGAAPKLANYQNFLIGKNGLTIIFEPYQVAPGVAGAPRVTVPYGVLQNAIDPTGILALR